MNDLANPYAAPKAQDRPEDAANPETLVDATHGRRLLNLIIDYVARGLLGWVLGFGLVAAGAPIHRYVLLYTLGFTLLTYLAYYVVCEYFFGATVGKLITGTRVVTTQGGKPRFLQIVGRSLARFVPFEPFSLLSNPPIGWHDSWSGTRVVRTR